MTEYELNYKRIKDEYKTPSYHAMTELYSKGYKLGLAQGSFDRNMIEQENSQLKMRIEKAIEYMKPRFMNCIDDVNKKRYFEDYYIQEIYEILKGDKE